MTFVFENGKLLKTILSFAKDINPEINLLFTEEGMDITCMGESFSNFLQIIIPASCFSEYKFEDDTREIGVNMNILCKCLGNVKEHDSVKLEIENEDKINISVGTKAEYQLGLIDIDQERLQVPETVYDIVYDVKSSSYASTTKQISEFCDQVTINAEESEIIFNADFSDNNGNMKIIWTNNTSEGDIDSYEANDIFSGDFSIKYLSLFNKINSVNEIMTIQSSSGIPIHLNIEYGKISINYFLAPKIVDDI